MTSLINKSLTIILPALNEEANIQKTATDMYHTAKELLSAFEIIIVDDGSVDQTYALASNTAKNLGPEIKVIRKDKNEGIGAAFLTGVNHAQCHYITCIASDGAYPVDGLRTVFSAVDDAPIVLGYRANLNERPRFRRFLSCFLTSFVRALTSKWIRDVHGVLIMSLDMAKSFQITYSKYAFQMQLLAFILNRSIAFKEVPVVYSCKADEHSGMIRFPVLIDVLKSAGQLLLLKVKGDLR